MAERPKAEMENVIDVIFEELSRAERLFPGWPPDPVHGASIVVEEAGELIQAALNFYYGREATPKEMHKEAVHTAAMAVRFLINLYHQPIKREQRLKKSSDPK